jgi:hypothetical protein
MPKNPIAGAKTLFLWTCGLILVGLSAWCLQLSIKFGLWAISPAPTPIDARLTFIASVCVTLGFFSLLFFAGILSFYLGSTPDTADMQAVYCPSFAKLAILVTLLIVSVLALSDYRYTTKVTVEETRGVPLPFLTVGELRGICVPGFAIWSCRHVKQVLPLQFVANILILHYAVYVMSKTYRELVSSTSVKSQLGRPYRP